MGLNLIPWAIAAFLALAVGVYVAHCEHVKKDQANFVAELRQQAQDQERRNKDRADKEKAAKEQTDEQVKNERNSLLHTIKRLRDERASSSSLPAAPANANRPDLACFDREQLAIAMGNFEAGMEEIAIRGTEATIDLNAAKGWALKLSTELSLEKDSGDKK